MKKKIVFAVLCSLLWCVSLVHAQMRVHQINVGQGSATLIEFPCAAILIDAGGEQNQFCRSTDSLKNYLEAFFERRQDLNHTLQCVYLTHPHIDHTRGVDVLLDGSYVIKNVVTDGKKASATSGQTKLHSLAQDSEDNDDPSDDIKLQPVDVTLLEASGFTNDVIDPVDSNGINPVIRVLWGMTAIKPDSWTVNEFGLVNNQSLVIKIEYGASTLLITGDLEERGQQDMLAKYATNVFDADVYLVGHHGSRNGTSNELLRKITPKIAMIEVGDPNHTNPMSAFDHGHPNKRLMDSLQKKIARTRTEIKVKVGDGQENFVSNYPVKKAIFATAWDNNIILEADAAGNWRKITTIEPDDAFVTGLININTATKEELLTLPGIGETKAEAIIQHRTTNGNFTSIDQLDGVPGIGPSTIKLVRPFVRI